MSWRLKRGRARRLQMNFINGSFWCQMGKMKGGERDSVFFFADENINWSEIILLKKHKKGWVDCVRMRLNFSRVSPSSSLVSHVLCSRFPSIFNIIFYFAHFSPFQCQRNVLNAMRHANAESACGWKMAKITTDKKWFGAIYVPVPPSSRLAERKSIEREYRAILSLVLLFIFRLRK